MKLLILIFFISFNSFSAELSPIEQEITNLSKKEVLIEFEEPKRGLSGVFHEENNFGSCSLNNEKLKILVNKIWYFDINPKNKVNIIWDACKKLLN